MARRRPLEHSTDPEGTTAQNITFPNETVNIYHWLLLRSSHSTRKVLPTSLHVLKQTKQLSYGKATAQIITFQIQNMYFFRNAAAAQIIRIAKEK